MSIRPRTTVAAILTAALVTLAACGTSGGSESASSATATASTSRSRTLSYAEHMPIKSLDIQDPQTYPSSNEADYLIYSNLITFDKDLHYVPGLATSWTGSPDGRTWTFHLREGVKFSDGTPFDSAAVKVNIERLQKGARYGPLYQGVIVETPDPHTVVFKTDQPQAQFLHYIAMESGGMASPTAVQKWGKDYGLHPVGSGPYEVQSFNPGTSLTLVPNPDYYGPKPYFQKIEFKYVPELSTRVEMLQTGEADVIDDVTPEYAQQLGQNPQLQILKTPGLRDFFLRLNLNRPYFDDVRVRQALNYAVDKEAIVKNLFLGDAHVLNSPAADVLPGHKDVGSYSYDPAKAKQLLQDAGFGPAHPLSFNLNTADAEYPKELQVAEALQQYFEKVGAQVTIQKVEAASRWGYLRVAPNQAKYDTALFGFNPSNGAMGYHLRALWGCNPDKAKPPLIWNFAWYCNPKADAAIAKAGATMDQSARYAAYGDAQSLIWNDAPDVWLYSLDVLAATRKDVKGVFVWPTLFISLVDASR